MWKEIRRKCVWFISRFQHLTSKRKITMFVSSVNPTSGKMEWILQEEDYDLKQEISRSSYTDMLHDKERNVKYDQAIKKEIQRMKASGVEPEGLDIGTGTGLLSMMCARAGCKSITAIETFEPMAKTAVKVITDNGFADRIKVIAKRSTDVSCGEAGEMSQRANLLVAELLDTELIGEGVLSSYRHAHKHLLQEGAVAVPAAAVIHCQLVQSQFMWDKHQLCPDKALSGGRRFIITRQMKECRGTAAVYDVQLDQVKADNVKLLTDPLNILRFQYCEPVPGHAGNPLTASANVESLVQEKERSYSDNKLFQYRSSAIVHTSGVVHGVLMWWTLDMDTGGDILLTTAPHWAHPDPGHTQWRDHWIQAVYFMKEQLSVTKGDILNIDILHDDYSVWFDVQPQDSSALDKSESTERPMCSCGSHIVWNRHRLAMLNCEHRSRTYRKAVQKVVQTGKKTCLCISDGSLLPFIAADCGMVRVITLEPSMSAKKVIQSLVDINSLSSVIQVLDKQVFDINDNYLKDLKIDFVLGEPYFSTSLLPWHNLFFWYAVASIQRTLSPDVVIIPGKAALKAIVVEFQDLWKHKARVGICEGFNLQALDDLLKGAEVKDSSGNHTAVDPEPHSLWEYPSIGLSDVIDLQQFDLTGPLPSETVTVSGDVPLHGVGMCHAVVIWMDYNLTEDLSVTTGLLKDPPKDRSPLSWLHYCKQGVYFLPEDEQFELPSEGVGFINYKVDFDPSCGKLQFYFGKEKLK